MLAVAERDLRRFRRNRAFMVPMVLMPIVYLVILGQAMGGDLHHLPVALVDQDHGPAAVAVQERLLTLQQSRALFRVTNEPDPSTAMARLRQGEYRAVVVVPADFSADLARGEAAPLGVVLDNTDNTAANVIEAELRRAMQGVSTTGARVAAAPAIDVQRVDVYGHKEFTQYLVPAVMARALFGILNVVTFFPSGALYPTESYPRWLQVLSMIFPMRYAVHALRALLLKGVGPQAVALDFAVMGGFALIMLLLAATFFKRTL